MTTPATELVAQTARAPVRVQTGRAMGSPLRLTVVGGSARSAGSAWRLVRAEFEAGEQAMSRFRESSDLMAVDRAAGSDLPVRVDRRLGRALAAAHRANRITDGRFDARVLGALEALGYTGVPSDPTAARRGTGRPTGLGADDPGRTWLTACPRESTVAVDTPVDLGGIGKGLALRWAWRLLERGGFIAESRGAMLEAGGDLVAGGLAPQAGPWIVAIEDPRGSETPVATVSVSAGAVTTSSVLVHRWTGPDGRPVHHLIDPRTGEPGGAGLLSVTVSAPDPAWAEVWSKTLFLAGANDVAAVARSRGLAAWWVLEDGRLEMTAGARARTTWVAGEA